jgi:hypothetical protein
MMKSDASVWRYGGRPSGLSGEADRQPAHCWTTETKRAR